MSSPGDALAQVQAADKKIAELEAELQFTKDGLNFASKQVDAFQARAEKAEAEVERLTNILRDILKHVGLCHDSSDSNLNSFYTWVDDTLGGGGRESGTDRKMKPSGDGVTPSRDAGPSGSKEPLSTGSTAANPAACTCAVIIGHGPCPVHGWSAARKERDEG